MQRNAVSGVKQGIDRKEKQGENLLIRVLQVLDVLGKGSGVSSVVLNYYEHINREKIQFDFMVNEPVEEKLKNKLLDMGAKIYEMPSLRMKNMRDYQKALNVFFQKHPEYQIVHGHTPNAAAFYLKSAKIYGVSVRIIHSHNARGADWIWKQVRNRLLSEYAIRQANSYMACGIKAARFLYGRDRSDVYLMTNAIDTKRFFPKEEVREKMREKWNLKNTFVIGHVGRFCPQKNQIFLLRIFLKMYEMDKSVRLLLIGDGEERQRAEKMVKEYHLAQVVQFHGVVEQVEDYMQAMDVFVLPSRYEGVPVSALEAQASGLPCVLSEEVTREIQTEYTEYVGLKEPFDKWAKTILKWKNHSRDICILKEYDIEKSVKKLESWYQEVFIKSFKKEIVVYQATHSQKCESSYEYIVPIQVGAANHTERIEFLTDDSGDHISHKNEQYCELTAFYWAWKNGKSDILGLCHYRRRFSIKTSEQIRKMLSNYDIIVPHPYAFRMSLEEEYKKSHIAKDHDILMKILEHKYSDYYKTAQRVFKDDWLYPYNMFIMKKEAADEYAAWLFSILKELEEKITADGRSAYQNRYIGFLAERLMTLYIHHHNLRVKECDIEFKHRWYGYKIKLYTWINRMLFEFRRKKEMDKRS